MLHCGSIFFCSKKKICIRICELLLLGQGEVREWGGGRREGEGKEMGTGREGKDKRSVPRTGPRLSVSPPQTSASSES